ncbi:MAG: hypothetical protein ACRD28_09710 [Acidobacteriaceae bacterium]
MKTNFLLGTGFSAVLFFCAASIMAVPAAAQQARAWSSSGNPTAQFQPAVFDGSMHAGWYSFPGQRPKLHFNGREVRIQSRRHSTVLLSRDADVSGAAVEVQLIRAPISTSSISGLGLVADGQHAIVIGLGDGSIVLWQLEPNSARVLARQPVNTDSHFEFRVSGGQASDVRFFWRHQGDHAWQPLGGSAASGVLSQWQEPLRFGLALDGPAGSEVVFSNYRTSVASETTASLQPMLVAGQ